MDLAKLYWTYVCMYFRSRGEYKASFFAGLLANFYCYFITYATFWILTKRFSTIGGWNFSEISILYGLNLLTYAISGTLFWSTIYSLENLVTTGGLDRFLLRPLDIIPQLMCQGFGYTFLGQIFVTVLFLITALVRLVYNITFLKLIYFVVAILGGVMIQAGAVIIVGALSFWTLRSTPIGRIVYYDIRDFVNYPLNIYPNFVKRILTFVFPWAFINYYPSLILLNKYQNTMDYALGLLAPAVGFLLFRFSLLMFKTGLKRYTSAGN